MSVEESQNTALLRRSSAVEECVARSVSRSISPDRRPRGAAKKLFSAERIF
jgi:hypothetical protein